MEIRIPRVTLKYFAYTAASRLRGCRPLHRVESSLERSEAPRHKAPTERVTMGRTGQDGTGTGPGSMPAAGGERGGKLKGGYIIMTDLSTSNPRTEFQRENVTKSGFVSTVLLR